MVNAIIRWCMKNTFLMLLIIMGICIVVLIAMRGRWMPALN